MGPTIVGMLLLSLLAGLWLTRPLWTRGQLATLRRRRANVAVYQSRLAEIDADLASGTLDAAQAQAQRDESAAHLLRDAGETDAPLAADRPRRLLLAALLVLLLGAGSGLAYYFAGDQGWRMRQMIALAERDPQAAQLAMLDNMIVQLLHKTDRNPDDAEAWAMLGRSYGLLQRYAEAADAYDHANQLRQAQPEPDWLVAAGEARGFADPQQNLVPQRALFERALQLQPAHPKALWYAGVAALQSGDAAAAFAHWSALRQQQLPAEIGELLDQQLPQLAARSGQQWTPAQATAASLSVRVTLAEPLRARLKPGMRLLVFAKAENGPPMPLAVQRIETPQFPLTVTLDDSMAMLPNMKLSQFERWTITARLTSSAGAEALSGDLEGRHAAARADAASPIDLVIDQQLP